MKAIVHALRWLIKAAIFFVLFAFALNNQHAAVVHFFFGQSASLPMALIVLISFAVGLAVGVLGMLSTLWRKSAVRSKPAADEMPTERSPLTAQDDTHHGF